MKIFDFLKKQDRSNDAEIYAYLHNNFDPLLVQKMLDAKFPGITAFILNTIEKIAKRPIFDEMSNILTKKENLQNIRNNIFAIVNIEIKFFDIFKDLGLTLLMLQLVGGPQAIINLPTNFGSVLVMSMFWSIFIPMLISSLDLAINNFDMFSPLNYIKSTVLLSSIRTVLLFLLSPLQPVFLEIHYLEMADEARVLAQNYDIKSVQKKHHCRNIKKQMSNFVRIELGKY